MRGLDSCSKVGAQIAPYSARVPRPLKRSRPPRPPSVRCPPARQSQRSSPWTSEVFAVSIRPRKTMFIRVLLSIYIYLDLRDGMNHGPFSGTNAVTAPFPKASMFVVTRRKTVETKRNSVFRLPKVSKPGLSPSIGFKHMFANPKTAIILIWRLFTEICIWQNFSAV